MTEADEVLRISDRFYILSTSARIDDRTRVLKHGDAFAVFDRFGHVEGAGTGELGVYGIYNRDTRHLSRFRLRLAGSRPPAAPELRREGRQRLPDGGPHEFDITGDGVSVRAAASTCSARCASGTAPATSASGSTTAASSPSSCRS